LTKAARDQGLASSLKEEPVMSMESLKQKARETFLNAARQSEANEAQALASKAKETFAKAVMDGTLESTLETVFESSEVKRLKQKVRQTILAAAKEGRLTTALNALAPKEKAEAVSVESMPNASASPSALRFVSLQSPSRTKRRIIGGVVRSPAVQDKELPPVSPFSATRSKSSAIDKFDFKSTWNSSPKFEASSKFEARLQTASISAMAMDLRSNAPSSSWTSAPAYQITPSNLRESLALMRPSASAGSLQTTKAKQLPGALLPCLAMGGQKKSPESVAQTMLMSKSTLGCWGGASLRGSTSMPYLPGIF